MQINHFSLVTFSLIIKLRNRFSWLKLSNEINYTSDIKHLIKAAVIIIEMCEISVVSS